MIGFVSAGFNPPFSFTAEEIEFLKRCKTLIVDSFTSPYYLKSYGDRELIFADREKLENYGWIFELEGDTAIIISGDAFSATTHFNIYQEAIRKKIEVKVFHNATIVPIAATRLGLQLYKIGPVVSLPRFSERFHPLSPYEKIKRNFDSKLHTIILLDISPPMTIEEAIDELIWMENNIKGGLFVDNTKLGALSRIGSDDESIKYGSIAKLRNERSLKPPLTLVLPGELHFIEEDNLSIYSF